ncbi:MAG: dipeptide epimerase [Phycisphaerae bacterium]|nr:dipeptide epimerase [Phycisphaerae bacterium]
MKLAWQRQTIHSRHPFHIARGGASLEGDETQRVIVQVEHEGIVGLGEAAPSAYYNQSCESAEAALAQAAELLGDDPFGVAAVVDGLLERFPDQSAAVAAIDAALHDWIGRKLGVPVWKLLGLDPSLTPHTSYTIGLTEPENLPARLAQAEMFQSLKLKVGSEHDEATLRIVRQHAPRVGLRVDANGAWSAEEALGRIEALSRFGLELIEQPLAPGQFEALADLRRNNPVPIIADEDCVGVSDVVRLAGVVDGVNVKLAKCGGISEACAMIRVARRLGLKVMLGCMIETSLGISAAAQLASLVDYVDLDGHLLLADDPFKGLMLAEGVVRPADKPGLGISRRTLP